MRIFKKIRSKFWFHQFWFLLFLRFFYESVMFFSNGSRLVLGVFATFTVLEKIVENFLNFWNFYQKCNCFLVSISCFWHFSPRFRHFSMIYTVFEKKWWKLYNFWFFLNFVVNFLFVHTFFFKFLSLYFFSVFQNVRLLSHIFIY